MSHVEVYFFEIPVENDNIVDHGIVFWSQQELDVTSRNEDLQLIVIVDCVNLMHL